MKKIDSSIKEIKEYINKETNNNPDIIFREILFLNYKINIIFSESSSSSNVINDFILECFQEKFLQDKKEIKDIISYLESNIPVHKVVKTDSYEELFYNLSSGFTAICIDGLPEALCFETKATLSSDIAPAQNEKVIKGPRDAFTENYQTNIGLIKRRIKSEKLWISEIKVGKLSQTKVAVLHINGIASQKLADIVKAKIKNINIDAVVDTNYVIETISENRRNVFPNFICSERPDLVTMSLLDGKIAIVVENSSNVIIIPILFAELFHSPEDNYQKTLNTNYGRVIRMAALFITLLVPALYIAVTTYNHEAIPPELLINFSTQRDGVPFPSIIEAMLMLITFEILRETDARTPTAIGSSLSIVGALVLGEAAVTAGIVSPIMVIVIAITAISGFIVSYFSAVNGMRFWRIIFLIFASLAGIIGIVIAGLFFIINLSSMKALGIPYLAPLSPLMKDDLGEAIFITNKSRFFKRPSFLASKNTTRGRE